jgi:hypothetical protein
MSRQEKAHMAKTVIPPPKEGSRKFKVWTAFRDHGEETAFTLGKRLRRNR